MLQKIQNRCKENGQVERKVLARTIRLQLLGKGELFGLVEVFKGIHLRM